MHRLLGTNLWPEVKKLTKRSQRVDAAIAYFTSDKYLRLKSGSTLIVDATENAIKSGATSARLLWKLRKKVQLYSLVNLHAKLIIADDHAVVGSANASDTSATQLHEAALLTNSPDTISQARSLLFQFKRRAEPLNDSKLKKLLQIKVVRRGRAGRSNIVRRKFEANGSRAWLVSPDDVDDDAYAHEQKAIDEAECLIKKTHPNVDPSWIRYTNSSRLSQQMQCGDSLVIISRRSSSGAPYEVTPPTSILYHQKFRGWTRIYYDTEKSAPLEPIVWKAFGKLAKLAGVRRKVTRNSNRILSTEELLELSRLWPRKQSRKK